MSDKSVSIDQVDNGFVIQTEEEFNDGRCSGKKLVFEELDDVFAQVKFFFDE